MTKHLNILYLSQYYPPEIGATQTRAFEMATRLVQNGHSVTVLTEFPNHPIGIIPKFYKGKIFTRSAELGVDVLRVWVAASPKKNFLTRIAFYISYMISSMITGMVLRKEYDLVFATSPPLFVATAGRFIAGIKRCLYFMEVRDLWPESAVVLGELKNKRIIRLSEKLELSLYQNAIALIGVTQGISNRLQDRGVPLDKIHMIPNGANTKLYRPGTRDPKLLKSLGINPDTFLVVYTGLHGLMHGLEFVMDVAYILQDQGVTFLFIGDGVKKQDIMNKAYSLKITNVVFLPGQQEEDLPKYIQNADAGLVTTKKMDFCRGTLPVKMFSYMACAIPVLLCVQGEAEAILDRAKAGLLVEPENVQALRDAILKLKTDPKLGEKMGENGREFVHRHYSRKRFADALENCFIDSITDTN
ncbi:glycosyltransferase family 4 protein [candidate division KSB1 bacterium]|nr:glycosyltransferase family 4 protein [candidate division KSB1 bacterium]